MFWQLKDMYCQVDQRVLLDGLNIDFNFSTSLAVVGASGAGKSIGLQCALGLFPFQKGTVAFSDGDQQLKLTASSSASNWANLRKRVMFVPQFPNLFDDFNVKANLLFPFRKRAHAQNIVKSTLFEQVINGIGLAPQLEAYPSALSPGQRKQVAIARAMLQQPKILVLDEPTADLDPIAKKQMTQALKTISDAKHALLLITHDVQLLEELKTPLKVIERGQMIWEGEWTQRQQAPLEVQTMLGL